jgi:hypothetical protein
VVLHYALSFDSDWLISKLAALKNTEYTVFMKGS